MMARDAQDQAKKTYQAQSDASKKYGAQADQLYGQLLPTYTRMATNPQGYDQSTLNNMTTAGMQSVGGSVAGAVGQGNLEAARTGNVGGYQYALGDAARRGMELNSDNALAVQQKNADLKQNQIAQGLNGLNGLYSSDQSTAMNELNAQNGSTNALTQAGQNGWFQNMLGLVNAGANAASGAGRLIHG